MNKTKTKAATGEGWAIHVYDSDRHLRFTFESSHLWAFGWGIGVGLLVTIAWSVVHGASQNPSINTNQPKSLEPNYQTDSGEDLRIEPVNSFPFGID
ncbi:MAG: hypothetical protein AAGM46_14545 [Cyanobacteria bacterium J06582_2]